MKTKCKSPKDKKDQSPTPLAGTAKAWSLKASEIGRRKRQFRNRQGLPYKTEAEISHRSSSGPGTVSTSVHPCHFSYPRTPSSKQALSLTPMEHNTYVLHRQLLFFPGLFHPRHAGDSRVRALHPPKTARRGRAALSSPPGAEGQRSTWS